MECTKEDCIYYGGLDEGTNLYLCKYKRSLYNKEENMCKHCRLWDVYIPENASESEKNKAIKWQNKDYDNQEDYEEYFK